MNHTTIINYSHTMSAIRQACFDTSKVYDIDQKEVNYKLLLQYFSILLCFGLQFSTTPTAHAQAERPIVVIDAGHGGHDKGAIGSRYYEKDIALSLALKIGDQLRQLAPQVDVHYTRKEDNFLPLHERIRIANNLDADLFVSVHCNSMPNGVKARGAETYVMGLHVSDENLAVAKRENAVIDLEQDRQANYGDFDPYSVEGHILLSAVINKHLHKSVALAKSIQDQIEVRTTLRDRGVKQAGFLLLRKAKMPSILIESAFLSDPQDEAYIANPKGQDEVSRSVAEGIHRYILTHQPQPIVRTPKKTPAMPPQVSPHNRAPKTTYRIQIAALTNPVDTTTHPLFHALEDVVQVEENGIYKYLIGSYPTLQEAVEYQKIMKEKGFNGAFVVTYQDDKRI